MYIYIWHNILYYIVYAYVYIYIYIYINDYSNSLLNDNRAVIYYYKQNILLLIEIRWNKYEYEKV